MAEFSETLKGLDASKLLALTKRPSLTEELVPLRRVAWAVLLRVVKGDSVDAWVEELKVHRRHYQDLVAQHHAELDVKKFDAAIANPLSRNAANPFLKKQANDELLQEIWKDIERTYPEVPLLQEERSRKAMQHVLFHWCKANNPAKDASESYRQGMNELVGVLYFAVRSGEFSGASSPAADLCGSSHSEADTFALFSHLMEAGLREMFAVERGDRPTKSPIGELPVPRTLSGGPLERGKPQSAILARCSFIFDVLLKTLDEPLHRRIQQHAIEPQIFLLRWLRLLFCREFHLEDTLLLWDAIFADSYDSPGLGLLRYSRNGGPVADRAEAASMALPLVDYTAVAMMEFLRQDLLKADESECLQRLLKFPPVERVRDFAEQALRLRSGGKPVRREGSSTSSPTSESLTKPQGYPGQPLPGVREPLQAPAATEKLPSPPTHTLPPSSAAPSSAPPQVGGGLLDAASNLFGVGKQALVDAKQRVSQLTAGENGTGDRLAAPPRPETARQAEVRRSLFGDDEPEVSQLAEMQKRLTAAEQERDNIKKKASEFVQAKKTEWNAKVAELEAKLSASEARVQELEAMRLADLATARQSQPEADAQHGEEDLRTRIAELESKLAVFEAIAGKDPELQRRVAQAKVDEDPSKQPTTTTTTVAEPQVDEGIVVESATSDVEVEAVLMQRPLPEELTNEPPAEAQDEESDELLLENRIIHGRTRVGSPAASLGSAEGL